MQVDIEVQGGTHAVKWVARGPGVVKEEHKAKSMAVVKDENEARHVIMAKIVDKAESMFMAYEDDRAQHMIRGRVHGRGADKDKARHMIMAIVAKEMDEPLTTGTYFLF